MKSLRKLCTLSSEQRLVLAEAAGLLIVVRLGLWTGGLQRTRRWLRRVKPFFAETRNLTTQQVAGMVMCAARRCPLGSTCLTRALTGHLLLGRSGYECQLRIGVARSVRGDFEAHAWLERYGQVILGGTEEDVNRFNALDRADELTV